MIDEKRLIEDLESRGMITDDEYSNEMVDIIMNQPQTESENYYSVMKCKDIVNAIKQIIILLFLIIFAIYAKNWWLVIIFIFLFML